MKAQIRMIIASVVVIALALTAVSGITYSWFSDTEEAEIEITTGKIDLNATYSDYTVKSTNKDAITLTEDTSSGVWSATSSLGGTVKVTPGSTSSEPAGSSRLAIEFEDAAPGDIITFNMTVTLVNSIYVNYKQSVVMDSSAPFEVTGFTNLSETISEKNNTAKYMIGTESAAQEVTIKMKETATVNDYADAKYTIVLAIQAIQSNIQPSDFVATKTIKFGGTTATTLSVKSTESSPAISVTLPASTAKASSETSTTSSVSVTAKALVESDTSSQAAIRTSAGGQFLAGVEISKSVEISPGSSDSDYFNIQITVGQLTAEQIAALKVYHNENELSSTVSTTGGEYYQYDSTTGVITIYAKSFSPFVIIDGCEAKIGTESYAKFESAIAAAQNGDTITLLEDVKLDTVVSIDKTLTLDLNGYGISEENTWAVSTGNNSDSLFWVKRGASLTVNDSSAGNGKITAAEAYACFKLTGKGESETGSDASLTINNGTFIGSYYVIAGNGTRHDTELRINGGTFSATANEDNLIIYSPQDGETTITGGTFTGYSSAIEIRAGKLTITGGTFTANATEFKCTPSGNGTTTVGAAIAIAQHTTKKDIDVSISGGTFSGVRALNEQNIQSNNPAPTVKLAISGGTFSGVISVVDATKFITGGTFSADPSSYVAVGYGAVKSGDNYVVEALTPSYAEGDTVSDGITSYKTLAAALEAIHNTGLHTLWCKAGEDVGSMTHQHFCSDLTIYGNGATVSGDFAPGYGKTDCSNLSSDVELKVYDLNGCSAWGYGSNIGDHKLSLVFNNCKDMGQIYFDGQKGAINATVTDCSFTGKTSKTDYSTAAIKFDSVGTLEIKNTTFSDYIIAINMKNDGSSDGTESFVQNITINECTFTDCGTKQWAEAADEAEKNDTNVTKYNNYYAWATAIRVVAQNSNSTSNLTTSDNAFNYSDGKNVNIKDVALGDLRSGKANNGTINWTGKSTISLGDQYSTTISDKVREDVDGTFGTSSTVKISFWSTDSGSTIVKWGENSKTIKYASSA